MAYKYSAAIVLLYFFYLCPVSAQKEADIWYFGEHAGISFTGFTPTSLSGSAMSAPEGCASIADMSGKLLFYTNSTNVWTSSHTLMVGGTQLAGNESTTQSALIIPAPRSERYFYIFTIATDDGIPLLSYSIVDMGGQGGQGAVIIKNILLAEAGMVTEKITAIRHSNRRDIWILVHGRESNTFYAFLLTQNGIKSPVTSNIGTVHTGEISAIGAMKATPNGDKIAVAIFDQGIEVFDFDKTTGQLSAPLNLFRSDLQGYYGVEFSSDGSKLYCSANTRASVYQFNMEAGSPDAIRNSAVEIWSQSNNDQGGALQLASDGKIYRARNNKRQLDVITYPNALGLSCQYIEQGVVLNDGKCRLGLPTIFPDYLRKLFTYRNACPDDTTYFTLVNADGIDAVVWEFGDPASGISNNMSTSFTPWHIYRSYGSYTVRLTTFAKSSIADKVEYEIRILPLFPPSLPRDTLLCPNSELILQAENPEYTAYQWSTNEQTPSIRVTTPGTYWVQVFNQKCTRTDTIRVHPSSFVFTAPPDTSLCADVPLQLQASGAQHYFWHSPIAPERATSATQIVATTATTTYTVTGTDANGCSLTRSFTIARIPLPIVALGNDTTLCYSAMHTLDAGISGAEYEWSTGARSQHINISSTGTYWVRVSTNGCSTSDTIAVVFATPHTITADTSICPGDGIQLQTTGFSSYLWSPTEGLDNPTIANPTATPVRTTTYTIRGTTAEGCNLCDSVTIAVEPHAAVSLWLPTLAPTIGTADTRIAIHASSNTPLLVLPPMRLRLHIDPQYFAPLSTTHGVITTSTDAIAVIDIPSVVLSQQQQLLTEIIGIPLIGNGRATSITVSVLYNDNCITTTVHEGAIAVQGCVTSERAVGFSTPTQLIAHSNPAGNYTELQIATIDDYGYTLALYDIHGREHWRYTTHLSPPPNTFATVILPTHTLANGLYQIVLTTPSAVHTHALHVLR